MREEIANRIQSILDEYTEISCVSVEGILEMIKLDTLLINRDK